MTAEHISTTGRAQIFVALGRFVAADADGVIVGTFASKSDAEGALRTGEQPRRGVFARRPRYSRAAA